MGEISEEEVREIAKDVLKEEYGNDIEHLKEDIERLKSDRFKGFGWFQDAKNYIEKNIVVSYMDLRGKWKTINNTSVRDLFIEFCKGSVVIFNCRGRGTPAFFTYCGTKDNHLHKLAPLWNDLIINRGGIPDQKLKQNNFTPKQIAHIKTFVKKYFKEYVMVDVSGIYAIKRGSGQRSML